MKNYNNINTGQWHLLAGAVFLIWLFFLPPSCNKKNLKDPTREKISPIMRVERIIFRT